LAIALSPDGKLLGVGREDGAIRLYETTTLKERVSLTGHHAAVTAMTFAPDGKQLASGGRDHVLHIWDATNGREMQTLTGPGKGALCLTYSADGKQLACGSGDNYVHLFNLSVTPPSSRRIGAHPGGPLAVTFSPDGKTLVTCGRDRLIRLWETVTGRERRRLKGHSNAVLAVALSPSGKILASSAADGMIRLWDLDAGRELQRVEGHRGGVQVLTFFADGKTLASGGSETSVLLWDVQALIHEPAPPIADLSARQLETLWTELASEDDEAVFQAVRTLSAAGKQSITLLRERVRPVQGDLVNRWLTELDADDFMVREKAMEELAQLGKFVEGPIRKALEESPSAEARRRLTRLLNKLEKSTFSPEGDRALRAIEVLERIGNAEAKALLRELAKGATVAELTREAKAALDRLANKATSRP